MQTKQTLIDQVIDQILIDLEKQDTTAIIELLETLPVDSLIGFLSEKV
jgi:hypothetical protein